MIGIEISALIMMATVQISFSWWYWRLVGKGRLFSRPLWRFYLFRPEVSPFGVYGWTTRLAQIFAVVFVWLIVGYVADIHIAIPEAISITVLYLDDYLTGDDEKWKRFKNRVRNKIKWRMHVPQPTAG